MEQQTEDSSELQWEKWKETMGNILRQQEEGERDG
jgi:hypothetical protein